MLLKYLAGAGSQRPAPRARPSPQMGHPREYGARINEALAPTRADFRWRRHPFVQLANAWQRTE